MTHFHAYCFLLNKNGRKSLETPFLSRVKMRQKDKRKMQLVRDNKFLPCFSRFFYLLLLSYFMERYRKRKQKVRGIIMMMTNEVNMLTLHSFYFAPKNSH